jgi:hypothetical protein
MRMLSSANVILICLIGGLLTICVKLHNKRKLQCARISFLCQVWIEGHRELRAAKTKSPINQAKKDKFSYSVYFHFLRVLE